jgi:hypothetical protein
LPPTPRSFARGDLSSTGFVGWRTWEELRANDFASVPGNPAAYVVYRSSSNAPIFLARNPGGRHKGKDPTVAVSVLEAAWVPRAHVVYIGKADVATAG